MENNANHQGTGTGYKLSYLYIVLIVNMVYCGRTDVEQADGSDVQCTESKTDLTCNESIPADEGTDGGDLLQRAPDTEIFPQATGTIYHDVLPVQWGTSPGEIGRKLAGDAYTDLEILKLFSNPNVQATSLHEYRIFCFVLSSYQIINSKPPTLEEYRDHMHYLFAGMPLYEKYVTLVNEYNI